MRHIVCFVLQLSLAVALVTEGRADEVLNKELAKKHFEVGERLFQTSNYPEALVEFKKAYQLKPLPELLYNIARCYEVLAKLEQAIATYELYLKENPTAENRTLVNARLKNLQARHEQAGQQRSNAVLSLSRVSLRAHLAIGA